MKSLILAALFFSLISPLTYGGAVVDRTPEGIRVGDQFLPDTISFNPKTLSKLTCFVPAPKRPVYEIAIPLGDWTGGPNTTVTKLTINGVQCRVFTIYSAGISHHQGAWITEQSDTARNVVILARAVWGNDERVVAEIDVTAKDGAQKITVEGQSPKTGGVPSGAKEYESFALVEEAGMDRHNEPVEVSVSVYLDELALSDEEGGIAKELRLYRIPEKGDPIPVPIQVFDVGGVPGVIRPDARFYLYSPSKTARIFFLADVPANKAVPYVITYGDATPPPAPQPEQTLKIEGETPGFIVSNEFYKCTLHPKCGQLNIVEFQGEGTENLPPLTNSLTAAAHWDPDSYGSNGKWGHTFAWDPPDNTNIHAQGPMFLRITNSGRMPDETPQVYASVTYSFYAGVPYVGVSTTMEVRDPYSSSALRNGELVLDTHLVTHFVWKDKAGKINRIPTLPQTGIHDDVTMITEPDIPWIAMTNELDGYGIAAIWNTAEVYQREQGTRPVHGPGYFLISHHQWSTPLTYFTRAWVFPFTYKDRRPNIMMEPGSVYFERGVFYPFLFKPGSSYEKVEAIDTIVRQPLIQKIGN